MPNLPKIYGFNRVVSKNHGFAVERDEKLWKHESLVSICNAMVEPRMNMRSLPSRTKLNFLRQRAPCSLEDVRAIDRRAPARHPTRKSNASKNGKTTGKGCKGECACPPFLVSFSVSSLACDIILIIYSDRHKAGCESQLQRSRRVSAPRSGFARSYHDRRGCTSQDIDVCLYPSRRQRHCCS
jgi:hypothetical protein